MRIGGYSDKNNKPDSYIKSGREKNDGPEGTSASSVIGTSDSPIQGKKTSDLNSIDSKSNLLEPILPVNLVNEVPIGGAKGTVKLS
ncbi:45837_t:CDS:2, partial [Gigaspora margarita]